MRRGPARTLTPRFAAFLTLALSGFWSCSPTLRQLRDEGLPPKARVDGVPAIVQTQDHCGPASLSAILAWAGRPETPNELAPLVFLPSKSGTLSLDLAREVRARGLLAYRIPPDFPALLFEVAAGHPALILENRGLGVAPLWHYSVLAGYDLDDRTAVLFAGSESAERVKLSTLRRTWRRGGSFALLALPPGKLPAGQDREGILSVLADLEETGQPAAAALGYQSYMRRWPGDWRGAFGWGNALYAHGDVSSAEEAFRRAHGTAPERPEPLNNLALLLWETGRAKEAAPLAGMAVQRANDLGLDPSTYEETLHRVRTVQPTSR